MNHTQARAAVDYCREFHREMMDWGEGEKEEALALT